MRIDGGLKTGNKLRHSRLYLKGYTTRGIDYGATECVQDEIDALRIAHVGGIAKCIPAHKGKHLAVKRTSLHPAETNGAIVAVAIKPIHTAHDGCHAEHQQGVGQEQVLLGQEIERQSSTQFQRHVKDGDARKGSHVFMRNDGGIGGNAHNHQHTREQTTPKDGIDINNFLSRKNQEILDI